MIKKPEVFNEKTNVLKEYTLDNLVELDGKLSWMHIPNKIRGE